MVRTPFREVGNLLQPNNISRRTENMTGNLNTFQGKDFVASIVSNASESEVILSLNGKPVLLNGCCKKRLIM